MLKFNKVERMLNKNERRLHRFAKEEVDFVMENLHCEKKFEVCFVTFFISELSKIRVHC